MRACTIVVAAILSCAFAVPVFAGVGSIPDNGTHYQINIIGVPKDKKVDMTDTQRRTIFVPLDAAGNLTTKVQIFYVRNTQNQNAFQVLDGNTFDDGKATVAVPYEYCGNLDAGCQDLLSYNVYAVALGKPSGPALVEAHCTYETNVLDSTGAAATCEDTLQMGSFSLKREAGTPKPTDISNVFRATGCLDMNTSGFCDKGDISFSNIWIFNIPQLTSYFWGYTNTNLKLMQLRFYPSTSGTISRL